MRLRLFTIGLMAAAGLQLALIGPASAETQIFVFNRLIDGDGSVLGATEIAISDGVITDVGHDLARNQTDAKVVDLRPLIGLPGLVDAHTHITYAVDRENDGGHWAALGAQPRAKSLALASRNARLTLETGVTSVRDLNAGGYLDLYLREQIASGHVIGPRVYGSGQGLHPGYESGRVRIGAPRNRPAEIMGSTADRIAQGVDWIKMFASTGSADDLSGAPIYDYDEIKTAVDTAHRFGKKIAVHSYGPEAARDAVKAGADTLEHAVDLDDDTLAEMRDKRIFYTPTIDHNRYYADHRDEYGYDEEVEQNLRSFVQRNVETLRRAHRAGVPIVMGSDAVFSGFGQNTRELFWFVEAGMSPAEAIRAAAANGAEMLGEQDRLGRLAVGYAADIVAVRDDPLSNIDNLISGVAWVMKDGAVVVDKR